MLLVRDKYNIPPSRDFVLLLLQYLKRERDYYYLLYQRSSGKAFPSLLLRDKKKDRYREKSIYRSLELTWHGFRTTRTTKKARPEEEKTLPGSAASQPAHPAKDTVHKKQQLLHLDLLFRVLNYAEEVRRICTY